MAEEREYILGTERGELERLRFQHQAWVKEGYALWERAGLGAGAVVLDLGCGPGYTSLELAHVVGRTGRVIARDISERFLGFLRGEAARLGQTQVEPSLGACEDLDLPAESLDAAYARWLFCWLPDPGVVLERVARALRPGGVIMLQEYFDWGAMRLVPGSEIFDRMVDACMRSWHDGGSLINVGREIPVLADRLGLPVDHLRPVARLGRVGSLEWRWLEGFFHGYLPKLVEQDRIRAADWKAFSEEWHRRTAREIGFCYTPTMVDIILKKPSPVATGHS